MTLVAFDLSQLSSPTIVDVGNPTKKWNLSLGPRSNILLRVKQLEVILKKYIKKPKCLTCSWRNHKNMANGCFINKIIWTKICLASYISKKFCKARSTCRFNESLLDDGDKSVSIHRY